LRRRRALRDERAEAPEAVVAVVAQRVGIERAERRELFEERAVEEFGFGALLPRYEALWAELAAWVWPVVAFESPQRLAKSLGSLAAALPTREVAVCRELTKRFEEVVRGPASGLAQRFAEGTKGEITVVIGPAEVERGAESEALAAVSELVEAGIGRRTAADLVARLTGHSRNSLYRSSL
jgi:16S rRNA (cytidine1402-2'-O)-methyltransferase